MVLPVQKVLQVQKAHKAPQVLLDKLVLLAQQVSLVRLVLSVPRGLWGRQAYKAQQAHAARPAQLVFKVQLDQ
jgi:hypothetical protein